MLPRRRLVDAMRAAAVQLGAPLDVVQEVVVLELGGGALLQHGEVVVPKVEAQFEVATMVVVAAELLPRLVDLAYKQVACRLVAHMVPADVVHMLEVDSFATLEVPSLTGNQ